MLAFATACCGDCSRRGAGRVGEPASTGATGGPIAASAAPLARRGVTGPVPEGVAAPEWTSESVAQSGVRGVMEPSGVRGVMGPSESGRELRRRRSLAPTREQTGDSRSCREQREGGHIETRVCYLCCENWPAVKVTQTEGRKPLDLQSAAAAAADGARGRDHDGSSGSGRLGRGNVHGLDRHRRRALPRRNLRQ